MAGTTCDVCAREGVVGVASSSLRPISLAFCKSCLAYRAQPLYLLDITIHLCGGFSNCASWVKKTMTYTRQGIYSRYEEVWAGYSRSKKASVLAWDKQNGRLL